MPMISGERALKIEKQLAQLLDVEVDELRDYLAGNIRTSSTRRTGFRFVRGTHGGHYVRDREGTDIRPAGVIRPLRSPHGRRVIPSGFFGRDQRISGQALLGASAEREHQDVLAAASGSDARRNLNVRSVSRIAAKPTMTFTQVRVSFIPTLKARSADRDALPRRV